MRRAEDIVVGTNLVMTPRRAMDKQIGIAPCEKPNQ
jgi:hypothetical protein